VRSILFISYASQVNQSLAASLMLSDGALQLLSIWDLLRADPCFEQIVESLAPKNN